MLGAHEAELGEAGGTGRDGLADALDPHIASPGDLLDRGCHSRDRVLSRFCGRLRQRLVALWIFAAEDGVEPTNNHAERVQRRAVLWRRKSFGCHSAAGCRFAERILTAVGTLKLQGRPALAFLREPVSAHRGGEPAPRLIPEM